MRVIVKVPATSANLGCGFDAFGLALELYSEFVFDTTLRGLTVAGEGAAQLQSEDCALLRQAACYYGKASQQIIPEFGITLYNNIPLGRGLGSSAAAIVAGLVGAQALCQVPNEPNLLKYATDIEGHPDNVSAALFGNLTVTTLPPSLALIILPMPADLTTVVFIPDFQMSTAEARKVLPTHLSRADTVHNASRTALFVAAIATNQPQHLAQAMDDRLHQPYRTQLFPQLPLFIKAAQKAGAYGAALSGAGSTVLAITNKVGVERVKVAFEEVASQNNLTGRAIELGIASHGYQVEIGV